MPVKTTSDTGPEIDPRRTLTLDGIVGNAPVRNYLRRAWREGKLPQSLLLAGPAGMGKTTLAYALAREIVAEGEDPATHRRALKVERGTHPDVIALTGKNTVSGIIPVNDVRAMEDRVATMPLESARKIVIIEPAEAMNLNSANALLKLLEEPPSSTNFILISPDPNRLLATIRSRCSVIELRPVPIDELTGWLIAETRVDAERARLAATLAEGRPGYARALLEGGMIEQRGDVLRWLTQLGKEGFAGLFGIAEKFAAAPGPFGGAFLTAMTLLRDALALRIGDWDPREIENEKHAMKIENGVGDVVLNQDLIEEIEVFARGRKVEGLLDAVQGFERAAAEAPYFYHPAVKLHFCECLLMKIGPGLRSV